MSLAVSIISFNSKDYLKKCLQNLSNQKTSEKVEIWVLDNNSEDGSAEMVEEDFPKVHLVKSEKNLGFAKGQNEILKKVEDDLVLVLNPDTDFENDFLEKMSEFMKKNSECTALSGKLVNFDGNLQSNGGDFPFGGALFNWLFKLNFLGFKKNFHRGEKKYYESIHEVDWLAGTALMLKIEKLKRLGFFNEKFFMYFEDVELCYRIKKSGGKIMLNPEIEIKHQSGGSSKDPRFTQWTGEFSGLIKFYRMHRGMLAALFVRLLVYLAIFLRIIAFAVKGEGNKSKTYGRVLVNI